MSEEELDEPARLKAEAQDYASAFDKEEEEASFRIGISNFRTNRAFVWTIEAARCLTAGIADETAVKLLEMALTEVKARRSDG